MEQAMFSQCENELAGIPGPECTSLRSAHLKQFFFSNQFGIRAFNKTFKREFEAL